MVGTPGARVPANGSGLPSGSLIDPVAGEASPRSNPSAVGALDGLPSATEDEFTSLADEQPAELSEDYQQALDEARAKGLIEPLEDE